MSRLNLDIDSASEIAFCRGDENSLKAAYDAHGSVVFSLCRKTLPPDRAADVTQEVFVSAWKARDRFDPSKGSLAAWLVGITKNRIVDNVRAEQRHSGRRSDESTIDVAVESEVDAASDRLLVADALRCLPERQRKMIELAYIDGLTHSEIAEKTTVPLGTVKSDIRRGLDRIRRHLGGRA